MKSTAYFKSTKKRPDRAIIKEEWIITVLENPTKQETQADGRLRFWCQIEEAGGKWLRVITLEDGMTVHNAFFDRTVEKEK